MPNVIHPTLYCTIKTILCLDNHHELKIGAKYFSVAHKGHTIFTLEISLFAIMLNTGQWTVEHLHNHRLQYSRPIG